MTTTNYSNNFNIGCEGIYNIGNEDTSSIVTTATTTIDDDDDSAKKSCRVINETQENHDKIGYNEQPTMISSSTGSEDIDDTDKDGYNVTDDDGNDEDENDTIDHDDDDDHDDYAYCDDDDDYDYDPYNDINNQGNYISTPQTQQSFQTFCNISVQADKEKSSSKLRVAKDLYRIMKDNNNNGFSIHPTNEDCIDEWTIHLYNFNKDDILAQDMMVCNINSIELHMTFPIGYPFEPPFVRVVKPRFMEQTGFVFNGALCMELLTKDGWNPVNDIESVIISIRSSISVGDGRLEAVNNMDLSTYNKLLKQAQQKQQQQQQTTTTSTGSVNNDTSYNDDDSIQKSSTIETTETCTEKEENDDDCKVSVIENNINDFYSEKEATKSFQQITAIHKRNGWDDYWIEKG